MGVIAFFNGFLDIIDLSRTINAKYFNFFGLEGVHSFQNIIFSTFFLHQPNRFLFFLLLSRIKKINYMIIIQSIN